MTAHLEMSPAGRRLDQLTHCEHHIGGNDGNLDILASTGAI